MEGLGLEVGGRRQEVRAVTAWADASVHVGMVPCFFLAWARHGDELVGQVLVVLEPCQLLQFYLLTSLL